MMEHIIGWINRRGLNERYIINIKKSSFIVKWI